VTKKSKPSVARRPSRRRRVGLKPFDAAEFLSDERLALAYLREALSAGDARVLVAALGDVARAQGMSDLSRSTGLGRENLYRALSAQTNPRIDTVFRVASALGMQFDLRWSPGRARKAAG
jgi:probable addiction module antidote protein